MMCGCLWMYDVWVFVDVSCVSVLLDVLSATTHTAQE